MLFLHQFHEQSLHFCFAHFLDVVLSIWVVLVDEYLIKLGHSFHVKVFFFFLTLEKEWQSPIHGHFPLRLRLGKVQTSSTLLSAFTVFLLRFVRT